MSIFFSFVKKCDEKLTFFTSIFLIISCGGKNPSASVEDILMGNHWYLSQQRIAKYDAGTGAILSDVTIQASLCARQSVFSFLPGGIANIDERCSLMQLKEGTWFFGNDSMRVYVPIQVLYGTGTIIKNIGMDPSQILEIDNAHFIVRRTEFWQAWSPGAPQLNERVETYSTFVCH